MGDIVREVRGLLMKRPDDEEQRMSLAVSLSFDPDRIAYGRSVIDPASHADGEDSWEWVNHPNDHTDHDDMEQQIVMYKVVTRWN